MGYVQSGHAVDPRTRSIRRDLSALPQADTLCAAMPAAGRTLSLLLLATSAYLAVGCGLFGPGEPPPGFDPISSSYACSDFVLEVRFHHPEEITIATRGEVATLERSASRAGDRYRGEGFTFWVEGEDRAFLQLPAGQIRNCFRIHEAPGEG